MNVVYSSSDSYSLVAGVSMYSLLYNNKDSNEINIFMIDNGIKYFYRLDNPLLKNYAVGDTIIVTARPMKLLDDFSLATYYVQPNFPSCNE